MNLSELLKEAHETATEKGWWAGEQRSFAECIALAHSELSEALEEYRNGEFFWQIKTEGQGKPVGIAVELADLLIRIFDTCKAFNIPLEDALKIKMEYNKTRPHRHGGKII
jgi:NTP pyrophosphatase (non-canonical NTP hydrolase)